MFCTWGQSTQSSLSELKVKVLLNYYFLSEFTVTLHLKQQKVFRLNCLTALSIRQAAHSYHHPITFCFVSKLKTLNRVETLCPHNRSHVWCYTAHTSLCLHAQDGGVRPEDDWVRFLWVCRHFRFINNDAALCCCWQKLFKPKPQFSLSDNQQKKELTQRFLSGAAL